MKNSTTKDIAASVPGAAPIHPSADRRQDAGLIALVGVAHAMSHFTQLLLAPLFPWLKDAFNVGYAELGFVLTVFFVVSCICLLYTSPSPRDKRQSRMPSSA